jgi:hypothetical protein
VSDDLEYKAAVELDGRPVLDEVARDDALAVRFQNPAIIPRFLSGPRPDTPTIVGVQLPPQAQSQVPPPAQSKPLSADAQKGLELLRGRQWVVDASGAPDLFSVDRESKVGDDAVLDSLEVLAYVRRVIGEHGGIVIRFNPDAIAYRPKEDPFPPPPAGSTVDRYDLFEPDLPKASDRGESGQRVLPDAVHFRKLSVYVKNGYAIAVREQIDLKLKLKDLRKFLKANLPPGISENDAQDAMLLALNAMRVAEGREPIRLRSMAVEFSAFGTPATVTLPTDGVTGDLSALRRRGTAHVVGPVGGATATP